MAGIAGSTGLGKVMMPVPDPHPDVFNVHWPLRVADIDREGRLKFDAATRHIQDIGTDHLRELGFEETHPLHRVPGHAAAAPVVFRNVQPVV
jgi:acyl-ACP thioesterase